MPKSLITAHFSFNLDLRESLWGGRGGEEGVQVFMIKVLAADCCWSVGVIRLLLLVLVLDL